MTAAPSLSAKVQQAKEQLDAHVRDIVEWHFNPATGSPFWLDFALPSGVIGPWDLAPLMRA